MEQATLLYPNDQWRQWIPAWLHEKAGLTNSAKTRDAYESIMASFLEALGEGGATLDSPPFVVATIAQAWASIPRIRKERPHKTTRPVGNAAHNQRIAVISSFYDYLIKRIPEADVINPMDRVTRRKIQENVTARALSSQHVSKSLAKIDQSTLEGKRDYALLLMAFSTGRRVAEIAALHWGDIEALGSNHVVIRFRHCKGGRQMSDLLDPAVAQALFSWLQAYYPDFPHIPPDTPLWMNLSRSQAKSIRDKKGLTVRGISRICLERLGTGKVHVTRHTFAHLMEESGAKISDIAARLGHENPAFTGRYIVQMHSDENPFASRVVAQLIASKKSRAKR